MKTLLISLLIIAYPIIVLSQNQSALVVAFTSEKQIFLRWMKKNDSQSFNVYRKTAEENDYTLINAKPVQLLTSRYDILKVLGEDYADFKKAFKLDYPEQIATLYKHQPDFISFASVYSPKLAMILGEGFIDNTVLPNNTYYYTVEVIEGDHKESLVKGFKLNTNKKILYPPKNIKATLNENEVKIYWDTSDKKVVGYNVYRSSNGKTGKYVKLNKKKLLISQNKGTASSFPNYVDKNIDPKKNYWYKVVAVNLFDESGIFSAPVKPD